METLEQRFVRLKRIINQQKEQKVRSEERRKSIAEENERIMKEMEAESGKVITSVEEGEQINQEIKDSIVRDIEQMESILREEGLIE